MPTLGGASINEYGQNEGGQAGDQTGRECYEQPFYDHPKHWVILRAKDPIVRKRLAEDMRKLCQNDKIGYSYWDHCYDLYNEVKAYDWDCSKVTRPVDTNCAKAVLVCLRYAGIQCADFNTGTEAEVILSTGEFEAYTDPAYTSNDKNLVTGDILVTATKGHTVIVTEGSEQPIEDYHFRSDSALVGIYELLGDTNVRQLPGLEYVVLDVLKSGTSVLLDGLICDRPDRSWLHLKTGGYVSEKLIGREITNEEK